MLIMRQARIAARGRFAHGRFELPATPVEQLEVRSASNQSDVVGVFPCGAEDCDEVLDSAREALALWRGLTLEARLEVVARIERPLQQRLPELAVRMQRELGRPPWEIQRELGGLVPRLHELRELGRDQLADTNHAHARVRRRPHGVVAILGPVMLPLASSHTHVVAALIAGNTVVWKPSPLAAASAQLYVEALLAAGLPAGVFNLVQGGAAVGRRLLADPRVDAAVFTGTAAHARELRGALVDRLDLTMMFHTGAKNPAVVLDDADLDAAASEIVQGAFFTAGQRCTAISRVLVARARLEPLLDRLAAACERLRPRPAQRPTVMGPMFSRERRDAFVAALAAAQADGASVVVPTENDPESLYVAPSIHLVDEPTRAARYRDTELFGPDLLVEPVDDLADALGRLRGRGGLYASLFSADSQSWLHFTRVVESGALLRNHAPISVSGRLSFMARGREAGARGPHALYAMARETAICHEATGAALPFADELVEPAPVDAPSARASGGGRS
jgi:succinylglutamic semialdehyde dehydrogenase